MPKYNIYCAEVSCKWLKDGNCTADTVCLSAGEISTVHEGRLHYWQCKAYEESEHTKQIREFLRRCGVMQDAQE